VRRSLAGLESLQRLLGVLPPTEIDTSNQALRDATSHGLWLM
jgi:hypothetical protein